MSRQLRDEELVALGRKLTFDSPSKERVGEIRNELLSAAAEIGQRSPAARNRFVPAMITAGVAIAAGVLLVAVLAPWRPEAPLPLAAVHTSGDATFERRLLSKNTAPRDEVVYLSDGVIRLDVRPLKPGERFRVITPDGEVEVRGTSFRVAVVRGVLREVEVISGRVDVRPKGRRAVSLSKKERWVPKTKPKVSQVTPKPVAPKPEAKKPKRVVKRSVVKKPPKPDPMEQKFWAGWQALKGKRYAEAAEKFEVALKAHPSSALAEDALYWRIVALSRSGARSQAKGALERFLSKHPRSPRAGEVAVMLGDLLKGEDPGRARKLFEKGAKDSSEKVKTRAKAALEAMSQ